MYICQNLPDFILNISVYKIYLSKNRAVHFSYLKLPYFAFILSNLIEKFEPAVQDWNSSIKNGMGADHGILSLPSLSVHVRYPMFLLGKGLFLIYQNITTLYHIHLFPSLNYYSVSSLWVTMIFILPFLSRVSVFPLLCGMCAWLWNEQINELLSPSKKGGDCKCVMELYRLYEFFRISSPELE